MDQDTDVHLRWNHHQTTLLSVFSSLLNNENLVDCTISAEGQHFKAHRVILSACSPYFELLFNEHCETHPVVILPDVKYEILKPLMEFMYSGEVKIPQDSLSVVLELAETLQIKGLSSVSDSEMKDNNRPKRRNESSILCDQQSFKKHMSKHRSGSQVKERDVSSIHTSEKDHSEDINRCAPAIQKCVKSNSNSFSHKRTADDAAVFQDIHNTSAFNMFPCSSASLGVPGERRAADLPPQMKQEDPDDLNSNSIEEIILDDDTDENYDHDRRVSGDDKSSTVGGRVIPADSFSGEGACNVEQYKDTYFAEPASVQPNQFKCDTCGRSYRYSTSLWRHLKYECGKEPQFGCCHCGARFFHKHVLKTHISRCHSDQ